MSIRMKLPGGAAAAYAFSLESARGPRASALEGPKHRHIPWDGASPPRFFVAWRSPAFDGGHARGPRREAALKETAALEIVKGLAFAESAPLYQRLVVRDQTLLQLGAWENDFHRDPSLFMVTGVLKPAEGAPAFEATEVLIICSYLRLLELFFDGIVGCDNTEPLAGDRTFILEASIAHVLQPHRVTPS